MDVVKVIQGWVGIVGIVAFGNTVSCFSGHEFLGERLYTGSPNQVNPLMARLFGIWTLLSAVLRIYCALNIRNTELYNMTFVSFVVALLHFTSEVFIYKTATLTIGIVLPLIISGLSIILMWVGYSYINGGTESKHSYSYDDRRSVIKKQLLIQRSKKES